MKLLASLGLFALLVAFSHGQNNPVEGRSFIRIVVRHGDPWAIKALIEGTPITQPELSAILGFAGVPDKESSLLESMFGGKGRLIVNPTDNSILFIPSKG